MKNNSKENNAQNSLIENKQNIKSLSNTKFETPFSRNYSKENNFKSNIQSLKQELNQFSRNNTTKKLNLGNVY